MHFPKKIVIIHYHFFPGGVTSSVRSSLLALEQSGVLQSSQVHLLCGHERGVKDLKRRLEKGGIQITIQIEPKLFYRQKMWPDKKSFLDDSRQIAEIILRCREGSTLFWAHNPTLGKNPALTQALILASEMVSEEDSPCRFLYHIHDFPECGRPNNLFFLEHCFSEGGLACLYPTGDNVAFACINTTDAGLLKRCGVPEERIFFLPNAIGTGAVDLGRTGRDVIVGLISEYAMKKGYSFNSKKPLWLMPIRLIRRKNALEAFFLAMTAGGAQILITLDANSDPEYPYANAVKNIIRKEKIPGVVGFGAELVGRYFPFDDLVVRSDTLVTTSLLEGFGFAFLEGPIREKPFLGRNLPHVTNDFGPTGIPISHLYDEFVVPVSVRERNRLKAKSIQFAEDYGRRVDLSKQRVKEYCAEIKNLYEKEMVDFGNLDLKAQLKLVPKLNDEGFVKDISDVNEKCRKIPPLPANLKDSINKVLGPEVYADRLLHMFKVLFHEKFKNPISAELGKRLKEEFFVPERNRPLFRV